MSADNGIYILKTPVSDLSSIYGDGFEYRVAELMAIENVYWDNEKRKDSESPDVHIKNAREMWKDAPVFHSRAEAMQVATKMSHEIESMGWPLEYGIAFIRIPRVF